MKFLVALGCVTNNKSLDFGGADPDHDAAIQELVENFFIYFFTSAGLRQL